MENINQEEQINKNTTSHIIFKLQKIKEITFTIAEREQNNHKLTLQEIYRTYLKKKIETLRDKNHR